MDYVDTGNFLVHVKTNDIYKDINKYFENKFDINFGIGRPLLLAKDKKIIGLMKK